MQLRKCWWPWALLFWMSGGPIVGMAQPYSNIELKKTGKYENRLLPAEKTGNKGFPLPKRIYNNTVSHYNYFFNAQQRMDLAIEQAKQVFKEDYTHLLPFYPYSLSAISTGEMDTIIYKCTAGILLHDLRSDWVDQFYLLMAKAYLHKRAFDSASYVLQYLNYAFAPKDDGYDLFVGSNSNAPGGQFTVSSPEKRSVWKKATAPSPARNEGLLLQAQVWIESGETAKASALLGILDGDPVFPKRLLAEKEQIRAQLFYEEKNTDSAAAALLRSLRLAQNQKEKARDYYLAAQLKALSQNPTSAIPLFEKAIQYHADPLMEVYARLALIELTTPEQSNRITENLMALEKMAQKGIYQPYADILYYTAAGLEAKRNNDVAASKWLQKSLAVANGEPRQRQLSWWRWAELEYKNKKYLSAAQAYDSIQLALLTPMEQDKISRRKMAMSALAMALQDIKLTDSLLRIAALPTAEKWSYLTGLAQQINQKKDLKSTTTNRGGGGQNDNATESLFETNKDFYFDNGTLKSRGLSEFQAKWGNRPNIDNWRRQTAVDRNISGFTALADATLPVAKAQSEDLFVTPESLANNLPQDSLARENAQEKMALQYRQAIQLFRVPLEDEPAALALEQEAQSKLPHWKTQSNPIVAQSTSTQVREANLAYEKIYQAFLQGNFQQALANKRKWEKENPSTPWSPQLLYVEALYHVKQGEDSLAKQCLQNLAQNYPGHALTEKALVLSWPMYCQEKKR
ncbi:MAG: hypothetical protein EAZ62_07965 [Sphingobacteriia bacterium]|nr:MAG: hypothetical protein EAZ62_07965 [Sphingobacteriia bacterium]